MVDSLRLAGRLVCQKTIIIAVGFALGFLSLTLVLANYANMVYGFGFGTALQSVATLLDTPARSLLAGAAKSLAC